MSSSIKRLRWRQYAAALLQQSLFKKALKDREKQEKNPFKDEECPFPTCASTEQ